MANEFKVKHGLIVNGSGSVVLDVQGSQGQLFSITDSLSGSLFKVSDISGIPIVEVFSDDTVNIGTYGAEAIKVDGSTAIVSGSFTGSLTGTATLTDLQVNGNINSTGDIIGTIVANNGVISGSTQVVTSLLNQDVDFGTGDISAASGSFSAPVVSTQKMFAVDFVLSSDQRIKENIQTLEIQAPEVEWKSFNITGNSKTRYGVIAQELEKTNPELVTEGVDGTKSVSYIDLLVLKMAEKDRQVEQLQKDIDLLKLLISK